MALSDQLTQLAARAKEAEDRAAAVQGKAKADVQADVEKARASAQERRRSRGVGVIGRIPSGRTESCVRACCGCGADRSGGW